MQTVDFETKGIDRRPDYPPEPVGLALLAGRGRRAKYLSWGHPGDDTPFQRSAAKVALQSDSHWLCHNGGFDVAVAAEKLGVPIPTRVDDTLFLCYLMNPYISHSLKPSAEHYLNLPPDEQDAVRQWLIDNKVVRKGDKGWGARIADAPSSIVAPYAIGDVERTLALFKHLVPLIKAEGMWDAYEREVALLPMLVDNEQRGVPIARSRLVADLPRYELHLERCCNEIYKLLGGSFNIDSGDELADMLEAQGFMLPMTEKGNRRTAKGALEDAIPNGPLKGWLLYHSALGQALKNFLRPWVHMVEGANESLIHVKWNQVKGSSTHNAAGGTKTGRLSSEPNFQNLTTGETRATLLETLKKNLGARVMKTIEIPEIRSYVEAPKGYTLFGRDFSQQELKILADAEEGPLMQAYIDNIEPHDEEGFTDVHSLVKGWMQEKTRRDYPRKIVKNVNFGKIYGLGGPGLSGNLKIPLDEAYEILKAHKAALPSVDELASYFRDLGDRGEAVYTIGGRRYYAEAPQNGRSVSYRLLNYYVQGSSADQTKQSMLNWRSCMGPSTQFLLQVHDELLGMCPTKDVGRETRRLNDAMVGAFSLRVPQRTTGERGKIWGEMQSDKCSRHGAASV